PFVHAPASQALTWGNIGGSFDITTDAVSAVQLGTVTVSLNGNAGSATVSVLPPGGPALSSVVTPSTISGGSVASGTVTLTGPAPPGGALVLLNTNEPALVTTPASVTVAAGATTATFTVTTRPVTAPILVFIDASYGSVALFARPTL